MLKKNEFFYDILMLVFAPLLLWEDLHPLFYVIYYPLLLYVAHVRQEKGYKENLKKVLAVVSFPMFAFLFGGVKKIEPAVCTLGILTLLKMFEVKDTRSKVIFYLFVILYLSTTTILSAQVFYLFVVIFYYIYIFYRLNHISHVAIEGRSLAKTLVITFFVSLTLFTLIPQVRLGNLGRFLTHASSGYGSELRPGDYTKLLENDEIYFYVTFDKLPSDSYWRGNTFNRTDGRSWESAQTLSGFNNFTQGKGPRVNIIKSGVKTYFTNSGMIPLTRARDSKKSLTNSYGDYFSSENIKSYQLIDMNKEKKAVTQGPLRASLRLPKKRDLKLINFVSGIEGSHEQKVESLIEKMRSLKLEYSKEVPLDDSSSVSNFLFDYKRGYCGHFASATAILLRYMGIPANVVGGFYGGALNLNQKYILVKGGNAHAWVEYWNDKQWVRLDPVERLASRSSLPESGIDNYLATGNINDLVANNGLLGGVYTFFEHLYLQLNSSFFQYDLEQQLEFYIGIKAWLKGLKRHEIVYISLSLIFLIITFIKIKSRVQQTQREILLFDVFGTTDYREIKNLLRNVKGISPLRANSLLEESLFSCDTINASRFSELRKLLKRR
jgi:hypothetical protein